MQRVLLARRVQLPPFEAAYLDYAECERSSDCAAATAAMVHLTPQSQFTACVSAIQLRWNDQLDAADSIMRGLDPKSGELRGRLFLPSHHTGILHSPDMHDRQLVIARAARAQYPGRLYVAISDIRALIALAGPPYSVDALACDAIDAIDRNEGVIVRPARARLLWRLGRWFPALMQRLAEGDARRDISNRIYVSA